MTPAYLGTLFFLQLLAILATCRAVGWLAHRFLGQPQVVGEMIAGVLLGPTLFGALTPGLQQALFPVEARGIHYAVAQLGVGLYMFLVGLGFRGDEFRTNGRSAATISISGIAAPFLLAVLVTPFLMATPGMFSAQATQMQATLFMGAAMAITAFPMLARIIHERGLSGTPLGTLALSAGAIDDAAAWSVLAIVLASFGDGAAVAVKAIVGGIVFALAMIFVAPRLLAPFGRIAQRDGLTPGLLSVVLMLFLAAAFAMDSIGIHAVFGGFLLGTAMPRGALADGLRRQLEPFAVVVLLPVFFTFSGLNTQLALIGSSGLILVTLAILAASILAKFGACWAAARLTGRDNPTSLAIGALMNARGLMELIIINIGLQRGVIGPALFAILVLMAILTTLVASPLFELVYGRRARRAGAEETGIMPAL